MSEDKVDFESASEDAPTAVLPALPVVSRGVGKKRLKAEDDPSATQDTPNENRWIVATLLEVGEVRENPLPVHVNGATARFPYGEAVLVPAYFVNSAKECFQEGQRVKLNEKGKQVSEFHRKYYQFNTSELPAGKQDARGAAEYARAHNLRLAINAM